jgi:hypothetical protein
MLKRAAFSIFVLVALCAGVWAYLQLKKNKKPALQSIEFFPDQAVVYLETSDIFELDRKISSRSLAVDGLRIIEAVDGLCKALHTIDSLVQQREELREQAEQATFHFAFYGSKKLEWLLGFDLNSVARNNAVKECLMELLNARQIDGRLVFSLGKKQQAFISVEDGVVLVSSENILLDRAKHEKEKRLVEETDFIQFRKIHPTGQVLSIFIDHDLYEASSYSHVLDLSLIGTAGFSGGDIEFGTSEVRINGFVEPDSLDIFGFCGKQVPFQTADLVTSLPAGCTDFVAFAADSFNHPLLQVSLSEETHKFWEEANDSAMYNVKNVFYKNTGGCLARFTMPLSGASLMMVTVRDSLLAREHLTVMSDSVINDGAFFYRLRNPVALMEPISNLVCRFALIYNQSIYFAERQQDLLQLLGLLYSGNVMGNDEHFISYSSEHITEKFNFLAWCSPSKVPGLISRMLNLDSIKAAKAFSNFRHFSYSLLNSGVLRSRLHLLYSVEKEQRAGSTLWTTLLDTTSDMQPALFKNHNTGENEILIQDDGQQLYLVSAKGEVLWKKKLEGEIISDIHVIDAFRNNKFQALFNTANAIHLVDRNGNEVDGFPKKLKAGTNCALSVFDYEGSRDYRIILPCSDRQIYNFGVDGKEPVTFVKPRTETEVVLPVQYVKIGGSEYLVTIDIEGKIYTFNRRGQPKGTLKNKAIAGCNSFYADAGANSAASSIFYADESNGLLNKISFTDKKEIFKLGQDMENGVSRFDLADNNRFSDLILCYKKQVLAFDLAGNEIYNKIFECEPGYIHFFNSPSLAGNFVYCPSAKTLLVHNRNKNTTLRYQADAPAAMSDLFRTSEQYLVYPFAGRLYCVSLQ